MSNECCTKLCLKYVDSDLLQQVKDKLANMTYSERATYVHGVLSVRRLHLPRIGYVCCGAFDSVMGTTPMDRKRHLLMEVKDWAPIDASKMRSFTETISSNPTTVKSWLTQYEITPELVLELEKVYSPNDLQILMETFDVKINLN